MFARKIQMHYFEYESVFLFGARQTGKTTFIMDKGELLS
jgi:predicted AAA+ superfamily ATPase